MTGLTSFLQLPKYKSLFNSLLSNLCPSGILRTCGNLWLTFAFFAVNGSDSYRR